MPRLRDIAAELRVDPSTVSRVLRGDPKARVSEATRQRILAKAAERNYRPDRLAASLKTGRTHIIAMLVPDLANPLFAAMFRGVEDAAAAADYNVILCNTDDERTRFEHHLRSLAEGHVDGLLIATARRTDPSIEEVVKAKIPYILLNRRRDVDDDSWIIADDHKGAVLAVEYLARLGHRRIGHIAGSKELSTTLGRQEGYRAGMKTRGLPIDPRWVVPGGLTEEAGEEAMARIVRIAPADRPTAILACNDLAARGAMRIADAAGMRVPEDLSVVGFTDMPLAAHSRPDLTTVHVPLYAMGRRASEVLIEWMRGKERRRTVMHETLPVEIVVRHSTTAPVS